MVKYSVWTAGSEVRIFPGLPRDIFPLTGPQTHPHTPNPLRPPPLSSEIHILALTQTLMPNTQGVGIRVSA